MNSKHASVWIYSALAQASQNITRNYKFNLNLIFLSLIKLLPICFASIWYNDEKTPNYCGLIMALFWYSFLNQFFRYWKANHQISLNERYYECFLEVLTRLGLVRFISETLEIHYTHETITIIAAALIVQFLQFYLKNQFEIKNNFVRFFDCQWVIFMQFFLFINYICLKFGVLFPFTEPIVSLFVLIHLLWFAYLIYQVYLNMKSFWHIKQKRRQYLKGIVILLSLFYAPFSLYILQSHLHSGVGPRLYMQAISALIAASYLSKKTIEKKKNKINFKSINLITLGYIVTIVYYLIYFFYQKKMSGQQENNHFFRILTKLFVYSIICTLWEFYSIGKKLIKTQQINLA